MPCVRAELPRRKPTRLGSSVYGERGNRVLISVAVQDRLPAFFNALFASATVDLLREQSERDCIGVLAYCLMPDHVHLLLRVDGDVDIVEFMRALKGKTTNLSWGFGFSGRLWQRSFHDHVLRLSEDEGVHLRYILSNPVQAGLVETWPDYPFCGSFVYDLSYGL